jgi:Phytanoyl-CoA dioxygenase (PhyH)
MIGVLVGISPFVAEESIEFVSSSLLRLTLSGIVEWSETCVATDHSRDDRPQILLCSLVLSRDEDASTIESFVREQLLLPSTYEVELWATAPAPLPLLVVGAVPEPQQLGQSCQSVIRQFTANESEDSNCDEEWVSNMRQWGLVTQRGLVKSVDELDALRVLVHQAIQSAETQLSEHRPYLQIGQDVILFQEIGSRGNQRFDLRLFNEDLLSMVRQSIVPKVRRRLHQLLGVTSDEEFDFDVSVVYSNPGASYQGWHADGDHQRNRADAGWTKDGWQTQLADPYAVCLFLPLIDLTNETGYTQFWPASHRSRSLAGFGRIAELASLTYDAMLMAGDGVFYDYRLWHRGMPNTSDTLRPVLQVIFKRTWYVERANYGTEPIIPV